jgi:hypothetical protein
MSKRRLEYVTRRFIERASARASESEGGVHLVLSVVFTGSSCGSVLKSEKLRIEGAECGLLIYTQVWGAGR